MSDQLENSNTEMHRIPTHYWDVFSKKWNSHKYLRTVRHWHMSDYRGSETCDLLIVECQDGRFFIEDGWGGDAKGHPEVFNPHEFNSYVIFFGTFDEVKQRCAEIISSITGTDVESLKLK